MFVTFILKRSKYRKICLLGVKTRAKRAALNNIALKSGENKKNVILFY